MDSRDKNVDCYADGQFLVLLGADHLKDNRIVFDYGPKFQRLKMEKFKSQACMKIESLLNSARVPDRDQIIFMLEDALKANLCKYQEFVQSYILDCFPAEISSDFNSQPAEFLKLQKIITLLLDYSVKILSDHNLTFVDHDQTKENECVIWAEIFHYLHFLFKNTRDSQNFFEVHSKLIKDEDLLNGRETFTEKIRLGALIEDIFSRSESLKFVYSLSVLFSLEKIILRNLSNCRDKGEELNFNPFWHMLPKLKNYFLAQDLDKFRSFCPVVTRKMFYRLVDIVRPFSAHQGQDFKLKDKIQLILIKLDLKALKKCTKITLRVKIVEDIGISLAELKGNSDFHDFGQVCEDLIKDDYFSVISSHSESIRLSVEFIDYCFQHSREEMIKFLPIFSKLELETLVELVNVQTSVSFVQESTLKQQVEIVKAKNNPNLKTVLMKLFFIMFRSTKNLKSFLQNLSGIPNLPQNMISKEFIQFLNKGNPVDTSTMKVILFDQESISMPLRNYLECEIINSVDTDFLLNFDADFQYFDFVFNPRVEFRPDEYKKTLFDLLIKKNPSLFKTRMETFIEFMRKHKSWVQTFCSWVNQGFGDRQLEKVLNTVFLATDIETDFEDYYAQAFEKVVQKHVVDKANQISQPLLEKTFELFFSEKGISKAARQNLGKIVLFLIKQMQAHNDPTIKQSLKNKLNGIKDITIYIPFITDEYLVRCFEGYELIILFKNLNEENIDEIKSVFAKNYDFNNILKPAYSSAKSNQYQDYIMIKTMSSNSENIPEIQKKDITYPKLAQHLLAYYPSYHDTNKLCRLLLKNSFDKLVDNINVHEPLLKFVAQEDYRDFLDDLITRIMEDDDQGICDLAKLLKKVIKKDDSAYLYFLNRIFNEKEKLLLSRKIKEISSLLAGVSSNNYEDQLNTLVYYIYECGQRKVDDEFEKPSLLLLSCLKMIIKFLKNKKYLNCFTSIIQMLQVYIQADTYFYPKSIEVRQAVYKILFMNDPSIINIFQQQEQRFYQIMQNIQPRKMQKYSQSLKDGHKGFENTGMVCYLNTCLILLSDHQGFQESLISKYSYDKPLLSTVLYLFAKLKHSYLSSTNAAKSLNKFPDLAISLTEQKDATEFLNTLLLNLTLENGEDINSPLEIQYSVTLKCEECNTENLRVNKEYSIMLEFNENESISSKIANFREIVKFEGDNMYECGKCKGKKNATQETKLKSLPDSFLVNIKRFSYEVANGNQIKLNTKVLIDGQISVTTEDQGEILYYLRGIVIHTGSAHAGHYFYFKKVDDYWVFINDRKTEILKNFQPERLEEFFFDFSKENTNPYLLLYSRQTKIDELKFPENILNKVALKNYNYLTITRFTRADLVELIIQSVKCNNFEFGMRFLFNYYSNIYENNENFMKNSKRLLKVFENLSNVNGCLDYISSNIQNIFIWGNTTDHYTYIKFEVIKLLLNKAAYEKYAHFYTTLNNILQQQQNRVNLTFILDLFIYIGINLLKVQAIDLVKYIIPLITANYSSNHIDSSILYRLLASNSHTLDAIFEEFYPLLEKLLEYTSPNNAEQLSFLLSKFYNKRDDLLLRLWNSQHQIRFKVLFFVFCFIGKENKNELNRYKNYYEHVFHALNDQDIPMIMKFAKTFYSEIEFNNLVVNKVNPILSSTLVHAEWIKKEIKMIYEDISSHKEIFIEFQGENKEEFYKDPYSNKRFKIIDKVKDVVLINLGKNMTEIKLLYHK